MLDDLTKAPLPMRFGDKTYEVSPLTQGDLGEIQRVITWEPFNSMRLVEGIPADKLSEVMAECAKRQVSVGSPEFSEGIGTAVVQSQLIFLSLRHRHPAITLEEIQNLPMADASLIVEVCMCLTNPRDEDNKKKVLALKTSYPDIFPG